MNTDKSSETKIPWFHPVKCGWRHRLGNIIGAFIYIIENVIIIITFGFIYPNFQWKWLMHRIFESKLFEDKKK